MPSRQPATSSSDTERVFTASTTASTCSLVVIFLLCLRRRKRTTPSSDSDSNPPHPFSFSLLRRATNSFSTPLGHGGFGTVFSGSLSGKPLAVKLLDSASLQGEREYQNELFFASRLRSHLVVPAIGFSSDPKSRRFLLVYDLMHNGNLHDALIRRKCPNLMNWKKRFSIILDIARGIHYLHSCDPPVIHGDIKPSNILLDRSFSAKIGDFGLARLKTESQFEVEMVNVNDSKGKEESESETESVNSAFEGEGESRIRVDGRVKDYVLDWIGKEVKKERPNGEFVGAASGSGNGTIEKTKKSGKKILEWWESMDDGVLKKEKRRPAREWWKDQYSDEIKKNKKKKKKRGPAKSLDWPERDYASYDDSSMFNGARWNSYDSVSGEIAKSGGVSTTPSMRGTVFYVAPECGNNGGVSEKCDVYSFGVLLLVIISGRRPLEVTGSPFSEFKRANLVSWSRHCARNGKLIELVDGSIQELDKEQALLCINIALLCLLKAPARRPSIKDVVGMLCGELDPPKLPLEYSQSQAQFPSKSRKEEVSN